ncbi:MAG: isoprenylcysteine carboxylmethyltransferase family protein [Bdellovibrionaceae bacterium]|jgi:protein-S-isoprenylcysteine O-methyltransferase Ste14|nr:isoprenylcysteine carboxylmethyltransferase family protein [Pseudobdellovibrionaceae bacterium]
MIYLKPIIFSFYIALISLYIFGYKGGYSKEGKIQQNDDLKILKNFSSIIGLFVFTILSIYTFTDYEILTLVHKNTAVSLMGCAISAAGAMIFFFAKQQLGQSFSPCSKAYVPKDLVTTGLYGQVRHPIYTGNLIFMFGSFLAIGSIYLLILTIALYFIYKVSMRYEEKGLLKAFKNYKHYQCYTPQIFMLLSYWKKYFSIYKKQISSENELLEFAHRFHSIGGVKIDTTYLKNAKTYGIYRRGNHSLVAGYIINSSQELRYLKLIPKEELARLPFIQNNVGNFSEITCIWRMEKFSKHDNFYFYLHSMMDAFFAGKKYIIGGTNNLKILKIQMLPLSRLIWHGTKRNADYPVWIYTEQRWLAMIKFLFFATPFEAVRRYKRELEMRMRRVWSKQKTRPLT